MMATPGAAGFFVLPETKRKLEDATQAKTILIGSFTGGWNFGDLLQLRGALRWQRERRTDHALFAVHGIGSLASAGHLDRLAQAFATRDWLFFSPGRPADSQRAATLGLVALPNAFSGPVVVHVYGGGFFNRLWGEGALRRIETLLAQALPQHYVISGQQVEPAFASTLAAHCRRFRPDIIGCRDTQSLQLLRQLGLDAHMSGDDAFEELEAAAGPRLSGPPSHSADQQAESSSFALYLNTSSYVAGEKQRLDTALAEINRCLELLARRFGRETSPVLIRAYASDKPGILDTWQAIEQTRFADLFPTCTTLDLVDPFVRDLLSEAIEALRRCQVGVSTSYHVTLLLKALGVPVYLFAFNEYYRQKREGLSSAPLSLDDFLACDAGEIVKRQDEYMASQRSIRQRWLATLATTLAAPPHGPRLAACTEAALAGRRQPRGERASRRAAIAPFLCTLGERLRRAQRGDGNDRPGQS